MGVRVFSFLSTFFENSAFLPPGAKDGLGCGNFDFKFFGCSGDSHLAALHKIDEFQSLLRR